VAPNRGRPGGAGGAGVIGRRLRTLFIGRLLGGDVRRWALYLGGLAALRGTRKLLRGEPEVVYTAELTPGHRVDVLAEEPAPPAARSRRRRKALEAQARAELGA
jgi:hypothetical protein